MTRWLALLAVAVVAGSGVLLASCGEDDARPTLEVFDDGDRAADYEYVIPAGTQKRIERGEPMEIMPERLEVTVGESIRITNEDDTGAYVGIFYVGAGETVRMRFTTPGELTGKCEVSSSGEFTIDVRDA